MLRGIKKRSTRRTTKRMTIAVNRLASLQAGLIAVAAMMAMTHSLP